MRFGRGALASTLATLLAAGAALAGCSDDEEPKGYSSDPKTLSIVAGSEQQAVLDTIVKPWCESKKFTCRFTLKGSVDQARALASGSQGPQAPGAARPRRGFRLR